MTVSITVTMVDIFDIMTAKIPIIILLSNIIITTSYNLTTIPNITPTITLPITPTINKPIKLIPNFPTQTLSRNRTNLRYLSIIIIAIIVVIVFGAVDTHIGYITFIYILLQAFKYMIN